MQQLAAAILALSIAVGCTAETAKIAFHVDQANRVHAMLNYINEVIKRAPDSDIHVILHGSAITRVTDISPFRESLNQLMVKGIKIEACSISAKNRNLRRDMLLDDVIYIEEGAILRLIALQRQGYTYIKI